MIANPLKLPYRVILGSQSPRRQQLLQGLNIDFEIIINPTDELFDPAMPVSQVPEFLAKQKTLGYSSFFETDPSTLLITADTIVSVDNTILNKPGNRDEAIAMLKTLSGKKHTVITGVCIRTIEKEISFSVSTGVHFKKLDDLEIGYYIDHYSPYDKAGSYGVQEWIGYICIEKIEGSYFNVMGLPIKEVYEALRTLGQK